MSKTAVVKELEHRVNYIEARSYGSQFILDELPELLRQCTLQLENTKHYIEQKDVVVHLDTVGMKIYGHFVFSPEGRTWDEMFTPVRDDNGKTKAEGGNIDEIVKRFSEEIPFENRAFFAGDDWIKPQPVRFWIAAKGPHNNHIRLYVTAGVLLSSTPVLVLKEEIRE